MNGDPNNNSNHNNYTTTTTNINSNNDAAIIQTAQDALETKWAAVQAGYFDDPYLEVMAQTVFQQQQQKQRQQGQQQQQRRRYVQPLIKRGTHARVCCMDHVISSFLKLVPAVTATLSSSSSTTTRMEQQEQQELAPMTTGATTTTTTPTAQVVVLGAGYDTSYFRLLFPSFRSSNSTTRQRDNDNNNNDDNENNNNSKPRQDKNNNKRKKKKTSPFLNLNVNWYEVDHTVLLCQGKATIIENYSNQQQQQQQYSALLAAHCVVRCSATVVQILPNKNRNNMEEQDDDSCCSCCCTLIGHDLRTPGLLEKLQLHGFDPTLPTLFVSECVQMYLPVSESQALLTELALTCPQACMCSYEPILGKAVTSNNNNDNNDSTTSTFLIGGNVGGDECNRNQQPSMFGTMMESNLRRVGLAESDSTLVHVRTLSDQLIHASNAGWLLGITCDLWTAYSHSQSYLISSYQRRHANQCEFLDEWEEFILIMQHYCLIVTSPSESQMGQLLCRRQTLHCIIDENRKDNDNGEMVVGLPGPSSSTTSSTTLLGFPISTSLFREP